MSNQVNGYYEDYAIATHAQLLVVRLDADHDVATHRVLSSSGHHYGIALDPVREGTLLAKQRSTVLTRYSCQEPYEQLETLHFPGQLRYVHQVAAVEAGIYFANSHYNSLVFRDRSNEVAHEFFFNDEHTDINHINSVYPSGELIFILLHNRGKRLSQVAILQHDLARGFELQHVMNLWHGGCHNLIVDGQTLYYNASGDGRLVAVDLVSQSIKAELVFPGHTKGLSLAGEYLTMGYSDSVAREHRPVAHGYLARVSVADMEVKRVVDLNGLGLPRPVGNINEVRCISGGERGHARSHPVRGDWTDLRLAQARPLEWVAALGRLHGKRLRRRLNGSTGSPVARQPVSAR